MKRLCLAAMLLLSALPGAAQFATRALTGVVTDKGGNALRGAAVQIESARTLRVMTYRTGTDGRYYFNNLNDDVDYTLRARYRKFLSRPRTLSKFNSSRHPAVNLMVPVG